jgi:hypothetical protein
VRVYSEVGGSGLGGEECYQTIRSSSPPDSWAVLKSREMAGRAGKSSRMYARWRRNGLELRI